MCRMVPHWSSLEKVWIMFMRNLLCNAKASNLSFIIAIQSRERSGIIYYLMHCITISGAWKLLVDSKFKLKEPLDSEEKSDTSLPQNWYASVDVLNMLLIKYRYSVFIHFQNFSIPAVNHNMNSSLFCDVDAMYRTRMYLNDNHFYFLKIKYKLMETF